MPKTTIETAAATSAVADTSTPSGRPTESFEVDDTGVNVTNAAEDETEYPQGIKLITITAALLLVLVAIGLDNSIVAIAVPALSDEFHSIHDIAWYSTSLRLILCSFMFVLGKAYTLFSIKWLFLLSLATFEAGNVLCTFAQSSAMFIIGRAVCGFGCSGLMGGVFTIFTRAFPLRKRALLGGLGGSIEMLASLSAPIIGGALITGWTWRACFGINIPLGVLGCAFIFFFLELKPNPDESLPLREKLQRLDLLGTTFFAPAIACLLIALQWGGTTYSWNDPRVIVLLAVFTMLLMIFSIIEWKSGEKAAIPFRILKNRNLLAGAFFMMCCNATAAMIEYYMSIYWQGVRGFSAAKSGLFALPMAIGLCVAAALAGAFTSWTGYYFPTMYTATVLASVSVGILTTIDIDTSVVKLLCVLAVLGFAIGIGIQAPQVAAQTVLDQKEVSIGISIVQFGSQMGPVVFLAAGAALFTNRLNEEVQRSSLTTNITSIDNMGLTDIRNTLGGDALKGVLTGYDEALVQTLYVPLTLACISVIGCVLMERRNVKKKQ